MVVERYSRHAHHIQRHRKIARRLGCHGRVARYAARRHLIGCAKIRAMEIIDELENENAAFTVALSAISAGAATWTPPLLFAPLLSKIKTVYPSGCRYRGRFRAAIRMG